MPHYNDGEVVEMSVQILAIAHKPVAKRWLRQFGEIECSAYRCQTSRISYRTLREHIDRKDAPLEDTLRRVLREELHAGGA